MEAKLAFEQASSSLAAQRTSVADLQSRAKDIIGLLTLSATFLGAFGKSNVDGVLDQLHHRASWETWVFIGLPVLTLSCCLYVMIPRGRWLFVINAESIATNMSHRAPDEAFADVAELYLAYIGILNGFVRTNAPHVLRRVRTVWLAMFSLAGTIATVGILVLSGAPTGGHT